MDTRRAAGLLQPCHQWQRGGCSRGTSCRFSHGETAGKQIAVKAHGSGNPTDSNSFKPSFDVVASLKGSSTVPPPQFSAPLEPKKLAMFGTSKAPSESDNLSAAEKIKALMKKRKTDGI
jgi:Zinc finger C-x8-C-x5-C-x3-H type (and similar)